MVLRGWALVLVPLSMLFPLCARVFPGCALVLRGGDRVWISCARVFAGGEHVSPPCDRVNSGAELVSPSRALVSRSTESAFPRADSSAGMNESVLASSELDQPGANGRFERPAPLPRFADFLADFCQATMQRAEVDRLDQVVVKSGRFAARHILFGAKPAERNAADRKVAKLGADLLE